MSRPMWTTSLYAVTLLAGAAGTGCRAPSPQPLPLAVLPIIPAVRDSSLAQLGKDLITHLSQALEDGGARVIPPETILAWFPQVHPAYTVPEGAARARAAGAGSIVTGGLVPTEGGLRLNVRLLSTSEVRVLARASVEGAPWRDALVDSAAATLLQALGPPPR